MDKRLVFAVLGAVSLCAPSAARCGVIAETVGVRLDSSLDDAFLIFSSEVNSADACAKLAENRTKAHNLRSSTTSCSWAMDGQLAFVVECVGTTSTRPTSCRILGR